LWVSRVFVSRYGNTETELKIKAGVEQEDGATRGVVDPHLRRGHWHSFWVGKKDQPDARSVTPKWLPPIPVNVTGVEDLTTTVRDVGNPS